MTEKRAEKSPGESYSIDDRSVSRNEFAVFLSKLTVDEKSRLMGEASDGIFSSYDAVNAAGLKFRVITKGSRHRIVPVGLSAAKEGGIAVKLRKAWIGKVYRLTGAAIVKLSDPVGNRSNGQSQPMPWPPRVRRFGDNPHGSYRTILAGTTIEVVGVCPAMGPGGMSSIADVYLFDRGNAQSDLPILSSTIRTAPQGQWDFEDDLAQILVEEPGTKSEWTAERWDSLRKSMAPAHTFDWNLIRP
jgi:hypothetical protein